MYADIIMYAEGCPIGCMVIEIVKERQPVTVYFARLLVSYCFPKVDGEYQNVTEEYIQERFERAKK